MKKTRLCLLLCFLLLPLAAGAQSERIQVGEDIVVEEGEVVSEAVCIGCNIEINGTVEGDAVAVAGDLDIRGTVGQDAVAVFGSVTLAPGAAVDQDAVAVFGQVDRDVTAMVGGETISELPLPFGGLAGLLVFLLVLALVTHIILVVITYLIAGERRVQILAETLRARAGASLLAGLGIVVAAIVLFILAAWMGPVAPVVYVAAAVALGVTLVVGYTGLCYWMGRLLTKSSAGLLAVLLGVLLVTVLQFVPLVIFVFHLLSLGCAALSGFGQHSNWLPQQLGGQPATSTPSTAD